MLLSFEDTKKLIEDGKLLHIAADEKLLSKLPKGNWIGGTTPYFIDKNGGLLTKDKLFVDIIDISEDFKIKIYTDDTIKTITDDTYENGFSIIIVPFASKVLTVFSRTAPDIEDIFLHNIIGWVSGYDLSSLSIDYAKTFDGQTGKVYTDVAVVLHIAIPNDKIAQVGIVNIFEADEDKPDIKFESNALEVTNCIIDGEKYNFAKYIEDNKIDIQLPLIANYSGVNVNISIQSIKDDTVYLYAPVFSDMHYHFAKPILNYSDEFRLKLQDYHDTKSVFSCNCILNYLYGELDGKKTPPFTGPITFGEIAYQLLNQTLVYIEVL